MMKLKSQLAFLLQMVLVVAFVVPPFLGLSANADQNEKMTSVQKNRGIRKAQKRRKPAQAQLRWLMQCEQGDTDISRQQWNNWLKEDVETASANLENVAGTDLEKIYLDSSHTNHPALILLALVDPLQIPSHFPLKENFMHCHQALPEFPASETSPVDSNAFLERFKDWRTCLQAMYRDRLPSLVQTIVSCYEGVL